MVRIKAESGPIKLDLGCGPRPTPGFTGVDIKQYDGVVGLVWDLRRPWPWEDGVVSEVVCNHFLEHLDAEERIRFFNELWRVMVPGAKASIVVPHWGSDRAYGDLTHKWPPIVEMFWYYLKRDWRAANAPHVPLACNFDVTWGYGVSAPWNVRSQETQMFALAHYRNAATDMIATLARAE